MTIDEVKNYIAQIKACQHDDEVAHSKEDALRADVLAAIADGTCEDPRECARLALTTDDLDFCRWCA